MNPPAFTITKTYKAGDTFQLSANNYVYPDHRFVGWSDGVKVYKANATYTMPSWPVTFVAQWRSTVANLTVSGTVTSYNPNNAVTIMLKHGEEVKYSIVIPASTGSGQATKNFSIPDVETGTYDLVVTKPGHLTYTITGVVVGSSNIDLTVAEGKAYQTINLLVGDVNRDYKINSDDLNMVWKPINYLKTPDGSGVESITDVNGDEKINSDDLNMIWKPEHYLKNVSNCSYTY